MKNFNNISKIENILILAAGRGSRMKPLTDILPKAMAPFFGHTLIGKILKNFNNKYKIQDILLYNVSLNPENIQFYSKNENLLDSSSKFLEPISVIQSVTISPSIFIFHKINCLFFIFKQLEKVGGGGSPKSILKPSTLDKPFKNTKKVRIMEKNTVVPVSKSKKVTRKIMIAT